MKKVFLIALIAGTFTACNNSGEATENKKDSLDSIASEKKSVIDSTAEKKDERIDSTTQLKKDSVERKDSLLNAHKKNSSGKKY